MQLYHVELASRLIGKPGKPGSPGPQAQPGPTPAQVARAAATGATVEDVAKVSALENQLAQLSMMGFGVKIKGSLLRGE